MRVSLVEPGATETELASHNRPEVLEAMRSRFGGIERMQAQDIADAIAYIVTRPRHVAVNEMLIRPTAAGVAPGLRCERAQVRAVQLMVNPAIVEVPSGVITGSARSWRRAGRPP